MNNVLIFSDLHISQSSIKECISILEELGSLIIKHEVDTVINLGDTFDSIKPSSKELDIFATFVKAINRKMIIIAANSHESTTQEESILNHYGILSDNIQVVKEYKDSNHLYCGHFSLKESLSNYDSKLSKKDFKDYLYVFLGHIHSYELIKPNILHLGSCRYVNFDEFKDKNKIVALITDYGTEDEKVHFLKLKSPISMIQLKLSKNNSKEALTDTIDSKNENRHIDTLEAKESISQAQTSLNSMHFKSVGQLATFLDKTDSKTKIKVKILDFESFRQFLLLSNKYISKFEVFKYVTEFDVVSDLVPASVKNEILNFKESFDKWLQNQNNIDSKIIEILKREIE